MNNSSNENISTIKTNSINSIKFSSNKVKRKHRFTPLKRKILYLIVLSFIINGYIIFKLCLNHNILSFDKDKNYFHFNEYNALSKSNIDYNDEFFNLKEVKRQMHLKKLKKVQTITGGYGHIGNALIMLNNLLNICINIKCKNVITPGGLHTIIRRPIIYKEYNITLYPNTFRHKPKIDIILRKPTTFWFAYRKKPHETRIQFIRDEIIRNIPKYVSNENDLYINIRSGDVFKNKINHMYSQPPLCFYQKIINENKFDKIFILSNGHENPVIGRLLKLYPGIRYIHGRVQFDISVILNAYNFVMPISTFPMTLIVLNNKLKNLYLYELLRFNTKNANYTVHKMIPSNLYRKVMQRKWKKSKKQLRLMIKENCIKNEMQIIPPNPHLSL